MVLYIKYIVFIKFKMYLIIYLYFVFRCPIDNGTPVFMVFVSGGQYEIDFLKEVQWSAYVIRQTFFTTVIFKKKILGY